jgi:stringent starvation protein B
MFTEVEFRDMYSTIVRQNKDPIITVDASEGEVFVPQDLLDEDRTIVLSIGPNAVRDLKVLNDTVYCRATFNKKVMCLSFPLANIIELVESSEG